MYLSIRLNEIGDNWGCLGAVVERIGVMLYCICFVSCRLGKILNVYFVCVWNSYWESFFVVIYFFEIVEIGL